MEDFVTLLGTKGGPAVRPGSTMPTSSLVSLNGQQIVVDCGLGVTRGLIDQNIDLRQLKTIIITHLHSDHYLELGPLIHTAWTAGFKTPLAVWGPAGLEDYWNAFLTSMEADIDLRQSDEGRPELAGLVSISTIEEVSFYSKDGLSVTAMRNVHPPLVDTFALSFRTRDRHVVFSGDTAPLPGLVDFAKGADLLIHEAMLRPGLEALVARVGSSDDRLMNHLLRSHTMAEQAAAIAQSAGVKALALHHLIPSDDPDYGEPDWVAAVTPHFSGALHVGKDGLRIPL
ncbi:MAG: MBL fold metallo-hydrolase [Pseudomonadota bacterium]|nr:MBL fold metallo-hydrolase [Pseudomonadota bacterium]